MNQIKICVIGLGSIGRRHLRLLSERDDVILCVADPSPKSKEFMAENYPDLPLYDSMQDAISAEKPESAIISTLLMEAQKEAGIRGCKVSVREIAKKYGFEY